MKQEAPKEVYERLLRQLDALEMSGRGESSEYDAVCDQMDEPWHSMTDEDQAAMRELSGQLNDTRKQ